MEKERVHVGSEDSALSCWKEGLPSAEVGEVSGVLASLSGMLSWQRPMKTSKKQTGRQVWSPGDPCVSQARLQTGTTNAHSTNTNKYPVVHLLWADTIAADAAGSKKTVMPV